MSTGRRQWISPLLTTESTSVQPHICRVCLEEIPAGTPVLFRAWHVEYSHVACNWIRPDEVEPHERTRPGSFSAYWEWQCPQCLRDACSPRAPDEATERRCTRCAPDQFVIALGARVELITGIKVRRRRGHAVLARGTRAHVRELRGGEAKETVVRVQWIGERGPDEWLPVRLFVRV